MSEHRCTCGNSVDFFTEYNSNQCGLYCGQCGKWQKWINKQEERLYNHKHSLVEHDANVRAAAIDECRKIVARYDDKGMSLWDVERVTDGILKELEQLKEKKNE